jgi:hypothetical protein
MTPISSNTAQAYIGTTRSPSLVSRMVNHAALTDALKTWKASPNARSIILFYTVRFWYLIWSAWVVLAAIFRLNFQGALLILSVGGGVIGLLAFASLGQRRAAVAFFVSDIIWTALIWSFNYNPWVQSWIAFWAFGSVLLAPLYLISLMLPIWVLEIKQGEVYITVDKTPHSEGFMLKSRPIPRVDADLQAELVNAGVPADYLERFLRFGAPAFMREEVKTKVKPGSEMLLQRLREQLADPDRWEKPYLIVAAMDQVWLLWDKSKTISVNFDINQVITEGGSPVNIHLQFDFVFDPEVIRSPEFRLSLPKWHSMEALEAVLKKAMEGSARKVLVEFFVHVPLESALTKGSIQKFREVLPGKLVWAKDVLGISVKGDTAQCWPIIHESVQEAETRMIAARAHAQADLARLRVLLDQVILGGVPPKLLAGLMMVDQRFGQMTMTNRTDDMLNLPEADENQQLRFFLRKYGFLPHGDTDILPSRPSGSLPPPPQPPPSPAPPPGPEPHVPDNPTPRRSRRRINLGKKQNITTMKQGPDGVYRVDPDNK